MEPSPNQDKSQYIKNILDKIGLKEGNVIQKYSEDILLISELLQKKKISKNEETKGAICKYCNKGKKAKNISISMIMEQNWKIKKKMNIKFY